MQELLDIIKSVEFYHEHPSIYSYHRVLGRLHNLLGWSDLERDAMVLIEDTIKEVQETKWAFFEKSFKDSGTQQSAARSQLQKLVASYHLTTGEWPPKED